MKHFTVLAMAFGRKKKKLGTPEVEGEGIYIYATYIA
jgi:hypothetical protein